MAPILAFILASTDKFTVTLDDGSRVRLLAVSDSSFKRSWAPDGSSVTIPPSILYRIPYKALSGESCLLLEIRLSHMPDTRGIPYLSSGPGDTVSIADPDDPQERFVVQEFVPPKADLHSFDFGVAVSGWNVAATARYKGGRRIIGTCFGDHWTATKLPLTIVENGHKTSSHMAMAQVSAQIPTQYEAYDWTLQAYDHKGKCLDSFPMYRKDGMLLGVQNAKVSEISKAQLLVRPIHHFTFRNVALQPKG